MIYLSRKTIINDFCAPYSCKFWKNLLVYCISSAFVQVSVHLGILPLKKKKKVGIYSNSDAAKIYSNGPVPIVRAWIFLCLWIWMNGSRSKFVGVCTTLIWELITSGHQGLGSSGVLEFKSLNLSSDPLGTLLAPQATWGGTFWSKSLLCTFCTIRYVLRSTIVLSRQHISLWRNDHPCCVLK